MKMDKKVKNKKNKYKEIQLKVIILTKVRPITLILMKKKKKSSKINILQHNKKVRI